MTRRPWTSQDQTFAEVAAACGVSYQKIGRALGIHPEPLRRRLSLAARKKHQEDSRIRAQANPEKFREATRRWRKANPEEVREKKRKYDRSWYKKNPDKKRENDRRYRKAHPERQRNRRLLLQKANPDKMRERNRRNKALRRAASRQSIIPATKSAIDARFALWRNRCAFCGVDANHSRNHGHRRLTEEHVMPLSNYGLDESPNIMPACKTCNSSKNASPLEEWYRRQPFFTEARWRKIKRHCPAAAIGQMSLAILP
jgi:hypothetical protein